MKKLTKIKNINETEKTVTIATTIEELERVVGELKNGTKKWGQSENNTIAIFCNFECSEGNVQLWIDNPNYVKSHTR